MISPLFSTFQIPSLCFTSCSVCFEIGLRKKKTPLHTDYLLYSVFDCQAEPPRSRVPNRASPPSHPLSAPSRGAGTDAVLRRLSALPDPKPIPQLPDQIPVDPDSAAAAAIDGKGLTSVEPPPLIIHRKIGKQVSAKYKADLAARPDPGSLWVSPWEAMGGSRSSSVSPMGVPCAGLDARSTVYLDLAPEASSTSARAAALRSSVLSTPTPSTPLTLQELRDITSKRQR